MPGKSDHHEVITQLSNALGAELVETDPAVCFSYGFDNSRRHGQPFAVLRPDSSEAVATAVGICSESQTSITPRGLGSGTTGAAVPINGGVVLSTERLAGLIEIDPVNRLARVQAGVTNGRLQDEAGELGFFWAPDPTSASYSTVGGNLACNAAGPRAVKYGTCRDNTLGLEFVDGRGQLLRTGVRTTKGVVGYDLTRLMIGSEGTLGIITEATLKLTPQPEAIRTLRADFASSAAAALAVTRIMTQPVTPRVLEMMDESATRLVAERVGLRTGVRALLMIEVDGTTDSLPGASAAIERACTSDDLLQIQVAAEIAQQQSLWAARRELSPALRRLAPLKINEDVVVPIGALADLIDRAAALGRQHGISVVCFGHAGNGNIHVNLLGDEQQRPALRASLETLMQIVVELGGTLSGEHGVGIDKREFMALEIAPQTQRLMHDIRRVFDPRGILNPGKVLPLLDDL